VFLTILPHDLPQPLKLLLGVGVEDVLAVWVVDDTA
jgi:hypothetical protein